MIRTVVILLVVGLLLAASAPVNAQDERRAKDIIDAYRVWKLTDVLDLSEEDMPVFFSRVKRIGEAEAEHRQAEREAVKRIGHLLEGGAGEAELRAALGEYEKMRVAHWNEIQSLREDAASMLTLEQRCEYTVFEERFRAEIRSMIEDVRRTRGLQGPATGAESRGAGEKGSGKGRR